MGKKGRSCRRRLLSKLSFAGTNQKVEEVPTPPEPNARPQPRADGEEISSLSSSTTASAAGEEGKIGEEAKGTCKRLQDLFGRVRASLVHSYSIHILPELPADKELLRLS